MRIIGTLRTGLCIAMALGGCARPATAPASAEPAPLEGSWSLTSAAGAPPSKLNLATWQITFAADHTLRYSGTMSGPWQGMALSGDGTWQRQGDHLTYKAGGNSGETDLVVTATQLRFGSDPVITGPGGTPQLSTLYARAR